MSLLRDYFLWNGTSGKGKFFFGCFGAIVLSTLGSLSLLLGHPSGNLFFFFFPFIFLLVSCPVFLILTKQRLNALGVSSSLLFVFPFGFIMAVIGKIVSGFGIYIPQNISLILPSCVAYICLLTLFPNKPDDAHNDSSTSCIEKIRTFLQASEPLPVTPFIVGVVLSFLSLHLIGIFSNTLFGTIFRGYTPTMYLSFILTIPVQIFLVIITARRLFTINRPIWMIAFFPTSYDLIVNFINLRSIYLDLDNLIRLDVFLVAVFYFTIIVGFFYTFSLLLTNKKSIQLEKLEPKSP